MEAPRILAAVSPLGHTFFFDDGLWGGIGANARLRFLERGLAKVARQSARPSRRSHLARVMGLEASRRKAIGGEKFLPIMDRKVVPLPQYHVPSSDSRPAKCHPHEVPKLRSSF